MANHFISITIELRKKVSWYILFVDDIVLIEKSKGDCYFLEHDVIDDLDI